MKRVIGYIQLTALLLITAISVWHYNNQPSKRELLLMELEEYAVDLGYEHPFITGFVPELADKKEGTLPLTATEEFDHYKLLDKIQFMEDLVSYSLMKDGSGLFPLKRHIYERVIIQTDMGRYSFDKNTYTLTLPSGTTFNETDYQTLLEIKHKPILDRTQLSVNSVWKAPIQTESNGDKIICSYNNGAEVTFINQQVVSIFFKGVDTLAGVSMY